MTVNARQSRFPSCANSFAERDLPDSSVKISYSLAANMILLSRNPPANLINRKNPGVPVVIFHRPSLSPIILTKARLLSCRALRRSVFVLLLS
jgi:hypothetical protein